MKRLRGVGVVAVFFSVLASIAEVPQPEGKSADYYRILLKNPRPGYLFDRFCNSWLEYHDLKELNAFLESKRGDGAGNLLLLALYHGRAGNNDKALLLCSEALKTDSGNTRILFYRAQLLESLGQLAEAAEDLETVADAEDKLRPDALKELGRVYIRQGLVAAGVSTLETLLKEQADDYDLQEEIVELKVEEGLYDEALADCDQMIKTTKNAQNKVMLSLRKSSILIRLERREEALETLDASLGSVAAGSWLEKEILSRIGRAFRTQDDLSGLSDHNAKLLEAHPNNMALLHNQISLMLERADPEAALKQVRALVKLAPMDESVREFYVEVLRECDAYKEAIEVVSEMLERNPGNNDLRIRLAGLYFHSDETDKIRPLMIDYLEHSPKKEYDYFRAARLMARFGDQNDATQIYLDGLAAYPDSLETREALAYHLVRRGMAPMAQTHIDAIQEKGEEDDLIRTSGMLCGAGRAEQAYAFLNGRMDDLGTSPRYLEAVYQAYLAIPEEDRPEDGMELAMRWLRASDSIEGLRRAAYAVQSEMRREGAEEVVRTELEANADRTVPETYLLAHLLDREAEPEKAWQLVDAGLEKDPGNLLLLRIRLEQARKQDNLERAVDSLERLTEAAPDKRLAWIREHVDVLVEAEDYAGALAKVEQWKSISRDNPQVHLREVRILEAQGQAEEAINRLRRAAFRLRDFPELQEHLAALYLQEGRTAEAEQVLWMLVDAEEELDPRLSRFAKLVEAVRWTDRMEAITDQMAARAEANKQAVFPLLALAECHRITWNNEARRKVLLKVLELKPDDISIMRSVAKVEADAGNHARSLALMRQIARQENNERALIDLAEAQFLYGDSEKGLEILRQECALDNADDLVKVAAALLAHGAADQLADLLAMRLNEFPDDYRLPFLYAVALEESANAKGAAETFSRLLAVDKERPGVSPHKPQGVGVDWFPAEELPKISRLIQIMSAEYQVYAYRNNRAAQQGMTIEPQAIDLLMPYTVIHLKKLMPLLDDGGRESVRLAMEQAEVPYVDMVMADLESAFINGQWWQTMLEKHPNDAELAYLAAIIGLQLRSQGMGLGFTEEQRKQIFDILEKDHPEGALFAIFTGGDQNDELYARIPELLGRCAKKDRNRQVVAGVLEAMSEEGLFDRLSPEVKTAFVDYAKKLPDDQAEIRIAIFLQMHDYEAFVKEIAALDDRASKQSARNRYQGFSMGYGNQGYIVPLSFPPQGVLDTRLMQYAQRIDGGMVDAVKTIGDPVVRLVLLSQVLEEAELAGIVSEIEAGGVAGFEKNVLLGSWYATRQEPGKALGYLIRARHSAPSAAARKRIDGAMLDCALVLEEMTDDRRRELKAAVLRLSSAHVGQQDATVLVELRKQLGMRAQKVASVANTAGYSSFSGASRSQSPDDKVRQLLGEGKTDQALREAAIALRRQVPAMMMLSSSGNDWELRSCMDVLKDHDMADQFIESLAPGDDATARLRLEYALALDFMGRDDPAEAEYEAILEMQPTWSGVCYRLATKMVGQPEEAAALLGKLDGMQLQEAMNRMQNGFAGNTTAEQCLHLAEMMPHLCAKALEGNQPVFAGMYLNMLERNWHGRMADGDSFTLPGLFDEIEKTEGSDSNDYQLRYRKDEKLVKVQQRRKELFLELCEIFINSDATARDGFSGKEQFFRFFDLDTGPLFELAEQVLLRMGQEPSQAMNMSVIYAMMDEDDKVGLEEYYAAECRRRDLRDRFDQTLAAVKDPTTRQQLELQQKFYFSTEAEFRELLVEQLRLSRRNNMRNFKVGALFRAYTASGYSFDLTPTLVELLDPARQESLWSAGEWMRKWVETCVAAGRGELAVGSINTFVEKLFPPSELAKVKPQDPGAQNYYMPNTIEGRIEIFDDVFEELQADLPTWFGLVEAVAPLLYAREEGYYNLSAVWEERTNVTAGLVLQTPFVNDWETFRSYSFNDDESMLVEYLGHGVKPEDLAQVAASVNPPTFGSRLLGCLATDKALMAESLSALCGEYRPQIEAASAARRKDLLHLLIQLQEMNGFEIDASQFTNQNAVAFAEYYQDQRSGTLAKVAERLLAAPAVKQANNTYQFNRDAGAVVRQLAGFDPATAVEVVDRLVEVGELSNRMGRSRSNSYSDPIKNGYNAILDTGSPGESAIRLMLKHAYDHGYEGGWLELEEAFEDHFAERLFASARKRFEGEGKKKQLAKQLAARETLVALDRITADYDCPPVLAATSWGAGQCGNRNGLVKWLGSAKGGELKHSGIYRFVAQGENGNQGAAEMTELVESGCRDETFRAVFAIRLFAESNNEALADPVLVAAAFKAEQVLPPEHWLDEYGSSKIVKHMADADAETIETLYQAWVTAQRKYPKFGENNGSISLGIANLLIMQDRIQNAAHILSSCKNTSISSLVVWVKLQKTTETRTCVNDLVAKIRKKDAFMEAASVGWSAADRDWFLELVKDWPGEEGRFARYAAVTIAVEAEALPAGVSTIAAEMKQTPFSNKNMEMAVVDLLTPVAKNGELDAVLAVMYDEETLVKYLKSGHNPGLSRVKAYVAALVRSGNTDAMAKLGELHDVHNAKPGCVHEEELRDAVRQGERDLGIVND
jgi:tetratricopeptide (TPR) repeat protein